MGPLLGVPNWLSKMEVSKGGIVSGKPILHEDFGIEKLTIEPDYTERCSGSVKDAQSCPVLCIV